MQKTKARVSEYDTPRNLPGAWYGWNLRSGCKYRVKRHDNKENRTDGGQNQKVWLSLEDLGYAYKIIGFLS